MRRENYRWHWYRLSSALIGPAAWRQQCDYQREKHRRSQRTFQLDRSLPYLGSTLQNGTEDLVKDKIPRTSYPKSMFATVQNDSLNDYVYRFLSKEQTDGDLEAIKGLITSI